MNDINIADPKTASLLGEILTLVDAVLDSRVTIHGRERNGHVRVNEEYAEELKVRIERLRALSQPRPRGTRDKVIEDLLKYEFNKSATHGRMTGMLSGGAGYGGKSMHFGLGVDDPEELVEVFDEEDDVPVDPIASRFGNLEIAD